MKNEQGETAFGSRKPDIKTTTDYARAIRSLREFSELNISIVNKIEDLSAHASLVGDDVGRVVLASDNVKKTKLTPRYPMTGQVRYGELDATEVRKTVGDYTLRIVSDRYNTTIDMYKTVGKRELSLIYIILPVGKDIRVTGDSMKDLFSIYAADWRNGRNISWHPASYPFDSVIQQGFTRLLQEAVKEVLSIAPPPLETSEQIK